MGASKIPPVMLNYYLNIDIKILMSILMSI